MSHSFCPDLLFRRRQGLMPAAVDLDDDESLMGVLFVPPDQMVAQGRAGFSKVELQPSGLSP